MERIVDGILFRGQHIEDAWEVRTWAANGIVERSARQCIAWEEVGPAGIQPMTREEYRAHILATYHGDKLRKRLQELDEEEEEARAKSLKKSAQRAKQVCRRLIISAGFNELLTLTYRENQQDRDACKRHFKLWVKRMKTALGGEFHYVAAFERQERGAMHVHVACRKLPKHVQHRGVKIQSWRLGTACWRGVVGQNNGLCYVGGKGKNGRPRGRTMSLAKLAQYVSKYILKDYEECPLGSNRYSRSDTLKVPQSEVMRLTQCSLRDLLEVTFEVPQGHAVVDHKLGRWHDCLWFVTEGPPDKAPLFR